MRPTKESSVLKFKNALLILPMLSLAACAGIHKSQYAKPVATTDKSTVAPKPQTTTMSSTEKYKTASGLLISGELDNELSSKHFGMVKFTFENTSEEWIKVDSVVLSFGDKSKNQNIAYVSGAQSDIYFDAMKNLIEIRRANDQAWAAAFAATYAAANTDNARRFNNAVVVGALTSVSVDQHNDAALKNVTKSSFPEGHLLQGEFAVPPGLFVYKWVLLNTKKHKEIGRIQKIFMTYSSSAGTKETVELDVKSSSGIRKWMADAPAAPGGSTTANALR